MEPDRRHPSGFTLLEILVAMAVVGIVSAALASFLLSYSGYRRTTEARMEVTQGLRGALDAIAREVRLAGACLPEVGREIAITGTNAGGNDTLTVRLGMVDTNKSCIRTSLTAMLPSGSSAFAVESTSGFAAGQYGYVVDADGVGDFFKITAVDTSGLTITADRSFATNYPLTGGVYAAEERIFALDTTTYDAPVLTMALNTAPPEPIASGIETFNVQYRLSTGCPTSCTMTDLPANDDEWRSVVAVQIEVTAQSSATVGTLNTVETQSESMLIKPRNFS